MHLTPYEDVQRGQALDWRMEVVFIGKSPSDHRFRCRGIHQKQHNACTACVHLHELLKTLQFSSKARLLYLKRKTRLYLLPGIILTAKCLKTRLDEPHMRP
ncbi:hypothetical protein HPP92_002987 [Vanilla planifolia]|uniref:Uncharacterized protein n=1 Tax=Vanilla planifolia TaxID=51239 RepID=A0A835VJ01_VANPL|nr:hypothetical protein HPP92_002987 [Vanilla planifolia]